jgi:hypothetical protein
MDKSVRRQRLHVTLWMRIAYETAQKAGGDCLVINSPRLHLVTATMKVAKAAPRKEATPPVRKCPPSEEEGSLDE